MNTANIVNNLEIQPARFYQARYEKEDPAAIAVRTGCAWDAQKKTFAVTFMGTGYQAAWPDFVLAGDGADAARASESSPAAGLDPAHTSAKAGLLILRYLLEIPQTKGTGAFLTYGEVPGAAVYVRQFHGRCVLRLAGSWGRRLAAYRQAMGELGAKSLSQSDAGFEIELFPGYFIRFLLWAADDEFPASAQILFSDNFAAGFHPEDLVVASEVVLDLLKKAAGKGA